MSYFKRLAQLIWVGSSVGGGASNKSVNLSELGLTVMNEEDKERGICVKLDVQHRLVGISLGEISGGWWWNESEDIAAGWKCEEKEDKMKRDLIGKTKEQCESLLNGLKNKEEGDEENKRKLREAVDCWKGLKEDKIRELKEEILKKLKKRKSEKRSWRWIEGILKAGTGWTWHKR